MSQNRGWRSQLAVAIGVSAISIISATTAKAELAPARETVGNSGDEAVPVDPQPLNPQDFPREVQSLVNSGFVFPLHQIEGYVAGVDSVAFTADSQSVISGGSTNDPHIKVWSVKTGEEIKNFRAQSSAIFALQLTPDGKTLVSSGEDGDIYFWTMPLTTGKFTVFDHTSKVLSLAVTPDSRYLVSGGLDGIKVWTLTPRRLLYRLTEFGSPGYALAMHPNGYLVASGDDRGRVRIWNLQDGSMVSEFFPHHQEISKLLFTQDGKILITGSFDRTIKLWDVATGQLVATLIGSSGAIRGMALSPNQKYLASASNDGIRIWSMANGRQYQHLTRHKDWVTSVVFSPDGHYLASGSIDRTVIIWFFPEVFALDRPSRTESIFQQDPATDPNLPSVPPPDTIPNSPAEPVLPRNPFPVSPSK